MPERGLSRREFLGVSGGVGVGLVLSFSLPVRADAKLAPPAAHDVNAWIRRNADHVPNDLEKHKNYHDVNDLWSRLATS